MRVCGLSLLLFLAGCWYTELGQEWSAIERDHNYGPGPLYVTDNDPSIKPRDYQYRIGYKDEIRIEVANYEEISDDYTVGLDGKVSFKDLAVDVLAEGKTTDELSQEIQGILGEYMRDVPRVTVSLSASHSKFYYIMGAVNSQIERVQIVDPSIKLLQVLVAAKPVPGANMKQVYVITPDLVNPRYVKVDASKLFQGQMLHNVDVRPGDIVYVPKTVISHVEDIFKEFVTRTRDITDDYKSFEKILRFWEKRLNGKIGSGRDTESR